MHQIARYKPFLILNATNIIFVRDLRILKSILCRASTLSALFLRLLFLYGKVISVNRKKNLDLSGETLSLCGAVVFKRTDLIDES